MANEGAIVNEKGLLVIRPHPYLDVSGSSGKDDVKGCWAEGVSLWQGPGNVRWVLGGGFVELDVSVLMAPNVSEHASDVCG